MKMVINPLFTDVHSVNAVDQVHVYSNNLQN